MHLLHDWIDRGRAQARSKDGRHETPTMGRGEGDPANLGRNRRRKLKTANHNVRHKLLKQLNLLTNESDKNGVFVKG